MKRDKKTGRKIRALIICVLACTFACVNGIDLSASAAVKGAVGGDKTKLEGKTLTLFSNNSISRNKDGIYLTNADNDLADSSEADIEQTELDSVTEEDDPIIMVSMGDSYSSGEGIEPFYGQDEPMEVKCNNPDWLAHRSENSWSSKLTLKGLGEETTMHDFKDENWFFVASSGAVTKNFYEEQEKEYDRDGCRGTYLMPPQFDIFDELSDDTVDYVTLTIGGNDVGFSDIITSAATHVGFKNPNKLIQKMNETWNGFYAEGGIRDDIKKAYIDIADKAGDNAKIIVAGYPKLLSSDILLFSEKEVEEINSNVSRFNEALSNLVGSCHDSGLNIYFASVEDAFDGHEANTEDPYINGVMLGSQPQDLKAVQATSMYSVHPNETGAEKYAECVQAKIDELEAAEEAKLAEQGSAEAGENGEGITDDGENSDGIVDQVQDKIDDEINKQEQKIEEGIANAVQKAVEDALRQILLQCCG